MVADFMSQDRTTKTHELSAKAETLCGHKAGGINWGEPRRGDHRSVTCAHCIKMASSPCRTGGHEWHYALSGATCWGCGLHDPLFGRR